MRRKDQGTEIYLNVYDLHTVNQYVYDFGLGAYHSGVEIQSEEWSFANGAGIFKSPIVKEAPGAIFRESIYIGNFLGGSSYLKDIINELQSEFDGSKYNVIKKNCNHFSKALIERLLNNQTNNHKGIGKVPEYINRLAYFGSFFSCLLPPEMLGEAPVNSTNNSDTYSNGYTVYRPPSSRSSTLNQRHNITTTTNTSNNNNNNNNNTNVNIPNISNEERRKRMKEAALKRFSADN